MSTQTTYYGLKKPESTDFYNIDDFNGNWDTLDTKLNEISNWKAHNVNALPVTPIQSYTTAGSYTYTPNFTGKVRVLIVGGGGSGAAMGTKLMQGNGYCRGGTAGGAKDLIAAVTSGIGYSVVVGAGGAAVSKAVVAANPFGTVGNDGGSSSFASTTATGGYGGGWNWGAYSAGNQTAPSGGSSYGSYSFDCDPANFRNTDFQYVFCRTNGAGASGNTDSFATANPSVSLPNGKISSASAAYYSTDTNGNATATIGTDIGCGGASALVVYSQIFNGTGTATSSAGVAGGVFIYRIA